MRSARNKRTRAPCDEVNKAYAVDAEQLVREHIVWMLALANRLLDDRALAEDAVQEAFIAAFRGPPGVVNPSALIRFSTPLILKSARGKQIP